MIRTIGNRKEKKSDSIQSSRLYKMNLICYVLIALVRMVTAYVLPFALSNECKKKGQCNIINEDNSIFERFRLQACSDKLSEDRPGAKSIMNTISKKSK